MTALVAHVHFFFGTADAPAGDAASVRAQLSAWLEAMMDASYAEEVAMFDGAVVPLAGYRNIESQLKAASAHAARFCDLLLSDSEADEARSSRTGELTAAYGVDLAEVICWRRGALGYMYIATVFGHAVDARVGLSRLPSDAPLSALQDAAESGLRWLKAMLTLRGGFRYPDHTLEAAADVSLLMAADADTGELFQQGIWSSVHVLAMAYTGELLFYRAMLSDSAADERLWLALAEHFVTRYLNLAHTVLQGAGWETARAESVLQQTRIRKAMRA